MTPLGALPAQPSLRSSLPVCLMHWELEPRVLGSRPGRPRYPSQASGSRIPILRLAHLFFKSTVMSRGRGCFLHLWPYLPSPAQATLSLSCVTVPSVTPL